MSSWTSAGSTRSGVPCTRQPGRSRRARREATARSRERSAGPTRSYGEVARAIGRPDAARDVGAALARNPFSIIVPCHRVVAADGALTGFSAPGGLATKRRMLMLEGAPGYGQQMLFD
jgi:methylated-DNA-[protein]-cysteine S-methyltransferase